MLISLAITSALLTATMVAVDACFYTYAAAANSASTNTTSRLVIHRLMTMIRTSTAHGPLRESPSNDVYQVGQVIDAPYIELIDTRGYYIRLDYREDEAMIYVTTTPPGGGADDTVVEPLLGGVTAARFYTRPRIDEKGVLILERGSIDITVQGDDDQTMDVERGVSDPIRLVASTMPRRLR